MKKGQVIFAEEALSLLAAFLAFALLFSNFFMLSRESNAYMLNERMSLAADNIADLIAKKYVDPKGNVDLVRLNTTFRQNVEVVVGSSHFGEAAPDDVNVYSARRLVFVNGQPYLMEVRVWP